MYSGWRDELVSECCLFPLAFSWLANSSVGRETDWIRG